MDKFSESITTALGLVAALAWNEAIQQLFTQLLGDAGSGGGEEGYVEDLRGYRGRIAGTMPRGKMESG